MSNQDKKVKPSQSPLTPSTPPKDNAFEVKMFGRNACWATFERHPEDIIRAYVTSKSQKHFATMLRYCAKNRKAYHIVTSEELEKISGGCHHEEVCLIRRHQPLSLTALQEMMTAGDCGPILYAEGLGNPHNQGAIMRVAAHFGVAAVAFGKVEASRLGGSAYRVAEGGADQVPHLFVDGDVLAAFAHKVGYQVYATSSHQGDNIFTTKLAKKSLFLLGAEGAGLSEPMMKGASKLLTISGTNQVESLNVSTATAVVLGQWFAAYGKISG